MLSHSQAQGNVNRGVQFHQRGELDAAETIYRTVLKAHPENADALHLLGVIAKQRRNYSEATRLIEQAIALCPQGENSADYHNNCAEAYRADFQYPQAFQHYQAALTLTGKATVALLFNLGGCFQELGQHHEAIPCFDQAIALQPDYARAYFRRAYAYLALGQFEQGWRDYEWHVQALNNERYIRPPWGGAVLGRPSDNLPAAWANSRTLLLADQGLGDEICLLRFAPRLAALGTEVTYAAPDKLAELLKRNATVALWDGVDRAFDHIYTLSDLPRLTSMTELSQLPAPVTLKPAPEALRAYQQPLHELPRPWVGITWRAGLTQALQSQRKELPLAELLAVLQKFQGTLVVLQRDIDSTEADLLTATANTHAYKILDLSRQSDQVEDALAIMHLLDDYVAVANTNVHLRAALGQPSQVLTAVNAIDYRWPADQPGSAWFPGSQAYRQGTDGSWSQALKTLHTKLFETG